MGTGSLLPCVGSWVREDQKDEVGIVQNVDKSGPIPHCNVRWLKSKRPENIPVVKIRSAFRIGMEVQDVPASFTRKPLGEGLVVDTRTLGGRDQVLVAFHELGEHHWLPFQNLKKIIGVEERFVRCLTGEKRNSEKFRLRSLAYALESWHENTGGLSQLDIDPLPHQIHLVHHILASGNLNWLIADDVGLGKTIEVGMLLSALIKRGTHKRILLITPAGLVNQWKEELNSKFGLDEFRVYGDDFSINEPRHWKLHDHVIGSVDRFKSPAHLSNLLQAEPWDLIIFDEAHRLSRVQYGMKLESSDRFRLAAALRQQSDAMLLLTATPHQGKQDKFQALLELIRPEFKEEIRRLGMNYEILKDMVIRNRKADVTDVDGNFIFQGKESYQVPVQLSDQELEFDKALRHYLKEGYNAMAESGTQTSRAIGFVMTTYRKLAASSIAAIERSLSRRLEMLLDKRQSYMPEVMQEEEHDERYFGEWEEEVSSSAGKQFFSGEIELLQSLIDKARGLFACDNKIKIFVDELLGKVLNKNPTEKVLIFSEYRGTQDFIAKSIRQRFGADSVSLLHGGQGYEEREEVIAHFEDEGQFLVSTEAGGEGINLHRQCHVMVNYDLPWNPMRIVQRVGRLYRYGQKRKVVVFNINVADSMDGKILDILYKRIDQVVGDMASVGNEFRPGLEAEILGEFVEALDVESILAAADSNSVVRSEENIEEAMKLAKDAVGKQRELLEYASAYKGDDNVGEFKVTLEHVEAFFTGMASEFGIEFIERTHKDKGLRLKLPKELAKTLGMLGQQLHVTFDRDLASIRKQIVMVDQNLKLFRYMLDFAKQYKFDGKMASIGTLPGEAIVTGILRWQNDQGKRMRQEYNAFLVAESGAVEKNPDSFSQWLMEPAMEIEAATVEMASMKQLHKTNLQSINNRLSEVSNVDLHPENYQLISGALIAS
ncbi:MAG: superfamily II DNA or RNA helicase [Desulforhopalus sp.]|jgi:superfamily II DNA or RNA helicase